MRTQPNGLAAAGRLKKREEQEELEMGSADTARNKFDSVTGALMSAEGNHRTESSFPGLVLGHKLAAAAASSISSSSSSTAWHHGDSNDMSGAWRDVIIHSNHSRGPAEPTATGTTTASSSTSVAPTKRKKTKKEVFVCHELNCGKQFPRSFALRRHIRIHTGNKPYMCDFEGCTQRFNTSGNLSRHKRIHSGERPYPCIFATCGKKFNTSTKLKRHMRIHFPEGQNVFRCIGLNCTWSCDNYKEFAAHQKLQHNIIVGAGLEAVSLAVAAVVATTSGNIENQPVDRNQSRSPQYEASSESAFSSSGYLLGYGKQQPLLPPPPQAPSRKHGNNGSSQSDGHSQYYENGYSMSSKKPVDTADHMYIDQHRRSSKQSSSYGLPPTFPSTDAPSAHFGSRGSSLASIYDSNPTLAISSESSSFGAPSHRGSSLFSHSLRHDDMQFKHDHDSGQYDHQPHPHASPAHHHILRPPPPPSHRSHGDHDGMKFPVPPPMNPAAAEFTGEELSVVLELMKDSYY